MTTSPGTQVRPLAETAKHRVRLLPPARYRHPGDVIRLITAGLVLAGALAVTITTHATYAGASAAAVAAFTPPALAGRVLAGLVQAVLVTAAAAAVVVTLRYRRFRLLAGLAGAAVLGGRGGDRDHSSGGRTAAPRSGGRSRPVAVADRRVAGGPRASGRRRGGHGRRRAVAQPPVAARCLGHAVACRRGAADHRHRRAGGSGRGVRRRGNGRGRRARPVRGARPAHRPRRGSRRRWARRACR